MSDVITRSFTCRVVKPVDGDWDRLGAELRGLQLPIHRVKNAAVTDLELMAREGKIKGATLHARNAPCRKGPCEECEGPKVRRAVVVVSGKALCAGCASLIPAQSEVYRLVRDAWTHERESAVGRKSPLDALVTETQPSGAVLLGVAGDVFARWSRFNQDRWKGVSSLPSWRDGQPIGVASSSKAVRLSARDGDLVLRLSLLAGRGGARELVVLPCGPRDHAAVRQVIEGAAKLGDAKLVRNGKRWEVRLVATAPRPAVATGGLSMALHHGVRHLLTYAIAGAPGRLPSAAVLEDGSDIVVHRQRYIARRQSLSRHFRALGKGARGHGKKRREQHLTKVKNAERRWTRTRVQQAAAHALRLARSKGVTRILVPSWGAPASFGGMPKHVEQLVRGFPLAAVRAAVMQMCDRDGVECVELPPAHESRTCPRCGHVNEERRGGALFSCGSCLYERDVDVIAAMNMLIAAGEESPVEGLHQRTREAAAQMRGAR